MGLAIAALLRKRRRLREGDRIPVVQIRPAAGTTWWRTGRSAGLEMEVGHEGSKNGATVDSREGSMDDR